MGGATAANSSGAEAGGTSLMEDSTSEVSCDEDSGPDGASASPRCTEAPTGETCVGGTVGGDTGGAGTVTCAPGSLMEDCTVEVRCDEDSDPVGAFSSPRGMEDGTDWMQFNVEPTTAGASTMSGERALTHGVGEGPWPREESRR